VGEPTPATEDGHESAEAAAKADAEEALGNEEEMA
jgi:hypothetical protein